MSQGQLSPEAAWTPTCDALTRHLGQVKKDGGFAVVGITAMPAAEKSVTVLSHVVELAQDGKAPGMVVYVADEVRTSCVVMSWNNDEDEEEDEEGPVPFTEITPHRLLSERGIWDSREVTFVINVDWYPTTWEEVLFSALVRWGLNRRGQRDSSVAVVLLMNGFESVRTMDLFRRQFPNAVQSLVVPSYINWPEPTEISDEETRGVADEIVDVLKNGGRVVVSGTSTILGLERHGIKPDVLPVETTELEDAEKTLRRILDCRMLALKEPLSYSANITRLELLVSLKDVCGQIMDTNTHHVMKKLRPLEPCEFRRLQSWALKAARPQGVAFLANYVPEEVEGMASKVEEFGPAWNQDIEATVLFLIDVRPAFFRFTPRYNASLETMHRLAMMGCVKFVGDERLPIITPYGQSVRDHMRKSVVGNRCLNFRAAYLLAMAHQETDMVVKRVLIRLAAFANYDMEKFFSWDGPLVAQQVKNVCCRATHNQLSAGLAWVALGLYLNLENVGAFGRSGENQAGPFSVNLAMLGMVRKMVKALELAVGIDSGRENWRNLALSDEQVERINTALMWAWLYRIVLFDEQSNTNAVSNGNERGLDCSSLQYFGTRMNQEVLGAPWTRTGHRANNRKFFAMYLNLEETLEHEIICSGLTFLPKNIFHQVEEKIGVRWPAGIVQMQAY